ncbi:D-serine ammonia-lyase [Janthinobacterium sp. RB2R34]|uniref:D-serine ammonia-lyase n=1 Tax=Janthinobacterium sp. RB2R34 TaxID=3424193 RepID=UPI003F2679D6
MLPASSLAALRARFPLIERLTALQPLSWFNPAIAPAAEALADVGLDKDDVAAASARLARFAPFLARAFPETQATGGVIESPLLPLPAMQAALSARLCREIPGRLWLKLDSHLPISGSIKARGGIYEVVKHAEGLALDAGLLSEHDDYALLASEAVRGFFGQYAIAVGSTGNLGLSIGIMGARLGFRTTVHMSADARQWKKDKLRAHGVSVIEYASDYSVAVEQGRRQAEDDPTCHFVDDENSHDLFLGYAVAGERLKQQFEAQGVLVDADHPLFVYLPCGVGGGPGGVAFGLKLAFGDRVHCVFVEPTHSPCMLLGVHTGLHELISVQDIGIDNITAADGLAVGRPSGFVGRAMRRLIDGYATVSDEELFRLLALLEQTEGWRLEPSAVAGFAGIVPVLEQSAYAPNLGNATHLVWGTGGSMVPEAEMDGYVSRGQGLMASE